MINHLPLALQNLKRSKTTAILSVVGIAVALSFFLFFSALAQGVRTVVFDRIFLTDSISVEPKKVTVGVFASTEGPKIDDKLLESLRQIEGVKSVHPRMNFVFPSGYTGSVDQLVNGFMNSKLMTKRKGRISFEMIANGIDPALLQDELETAPHFRDLSPLRTCADDESCGDGSTCDEGTCTTRACNPSIRETGCGSGLYCADSIGPKGTRVHRCEAPIPVVVSEHLLEVYNGGLARSMNLPAISTEITRAIQPTLMIHLGHSFMSNGDRSRALMKKIRLVGVSRRAIPVGITMPLPYVERFNAFFKGENAGQTYHSVVLKIRDQRHLDRIKESLESLNLVLGEDTANAEKAGQILRTVEVVLSLLSVLILGVVSMNLSQMFFLIIQQRRRELGLFRSLGATQRDVRHLIHLEAAIIGLTGSLIACALAILAGTGVDILLPFVPYFPYKPDSLFVFEPLTFVLALVVAQLFCLFGAFFPAKHAARLSPARALREI